MGNALSDIGENYNFKEVHSSQHPLFGPIQLLSCSIQDYPDIEIYMKVTTKLNNLQHSQFIKRFLKIQNMHKHDTYVPFLVYISNNIFECPSHSLYDEIQVKRSAGTLFTEPELWYLAKSLIAAYSSLLQIPELIKQQQMTLHNIFITKKGEVKLSLPTLFVIQADQFRNQYIEESSVGHKMNREIGLILLEASSLSFEDSIKMMETNYTSEYCNFVHDLLQDSKSLQYFQNYQMSKKMAKTIYNLKKTKTNQVKSLKESQIIETFHIKSPTKTEPNQFDQVSKIASLPEGNQDSEKIFDLQQLQQANQIPQQQQTEQNQQSQHIQLQQNQIQQQQQQQLQIQQQSFPQKLELQNNKSSEIVVHQKKQSLQLNYMAPTIGPSESDDVFSDNFNSRYWRAIEKAKRQIMIFEQRSKQIY